MDRYHQAERELAERVSLFATTETNLKVFHISGGLPEEDVLPEDALYWLLEDLNAICNGKEPYWFNLASSPELVFEAGMLRKARRLLVCAESEQIARDVYARLSRALKEGQDLPNLLDSFRDHQRQFNDLRSLRECLEKDLQIWLKEPILLKKCNLLKKRGR
ncbi:MAG: hypothetical protein DDT32_01227 [Syntrophomonadaceae bacterium]|nr:hypothetical protein [Bacillota bacterium]MBT9147470.1 hypothetical protein [Bacillota bacterium]